MPKLVALSDIHSKIEAILFYENAYISHEQLLSKLSVDSVHHDDLERMIEELNTHYRKRNHSLTIVKDDNNYRLVINKKLAIQLAEIYNISRQKKISKALMETLSIIAYGQPITTAEINDLRGVNSSATIKILIEEKLVRVTGKKSIPGSPNLYGTSSEFLRRFGLHSIKDLPKMNDRDSIKFLETASKSSNSYGHGKSKHSTATSDTDVSSK